MTSVGDELQAMRECFHSLEPLDKESRARAMRWLAQALMSAPVARPTPPSNERPDYELPVAATERTP
jgi:hypothetical protein